LNPNSVPAHSDYGMILSLEGRFDESLEQIRLAESLDPLSARTRWLHASTVLSLKYLISSSKVLEYGHSRDGRSHCDGFWDLAILDSHRLCRRNLCGG
jgi:hypothetical protein